MWRLTLVIAAVLSIAMWLGGGTLNRRTPSLHPPASPQLVPPAILEDAANSAVPAALSVLPPSPTPLLPVRDAVSDEGSNATAHLPKPDPTPPGCPRVYFRFINDFGGHNNQLLSLLNAFTMGKRYGYTLVLPNFIEGINKGPKSFTNPQHVYDLSLLRKANFCFVPYHSKNYGPVLKYTAYQMFRLQASKTSRPYDLLRPAPFLMNEVQGVLSRLPPRFTGVHRRTEIAGMYSCRGHHRAGYCHMMPAYIRQCQALTNHSQEDPIFLATDSNPPRSFNIPFVRYHGQFARKKLYSVIIDAWVLVHASLVIANPGSSLALNVCNVRRMQQPPRDCYNFTYCHDRSPYVSGWPCGSPVHGIAAFFPPKWQKKQQAKIKGAQLHNPNVLTPPHVVDPSADPDLH